MTWLAVLEAEQPNVVAAMRSALAAREGHAAMRLAAGAAMFWWLSGHRAEGMELITAATDLPGDVPDETRALVYAMIVQFLSSGHGDAQRAQEWIRAAHDLTRHSPSTLGRYPMLRLMAPLEAMLGATDTTLIALEALLDDEDPWVSAMARLHLGKMRNLHGDGGPEADEYLESALSQFRSVGERFGISFALTELADRISARGEFGRACEYYEEAITAVTEIGAVDDIIRMRARLGQLYWLLGDEAASAAAVAEAARFAERTTWPDTLADLAVSQAELARWKGDDDQARRQLATGIAHFADQAELPNLRAWIHDLLGYLTDDPDEARAYRRTACQAAADSGLATQLAAVLVGVADQAHRDGRPEQAARVIGASIAVRGLRDRTWPDLDRVETAVRDHLGETRYADAVREGAHSHWSAVVEPVLNP